VGPEQWGGSVSCRWFYPGLAHPLIGSYRPGLEPLGTEAPELNSRRQLPSAQTGWLPEESESQDRVHRRLAIHLAEWREPVLGVMHHSIQYETDLWHDLRRLGEYRYGALCRVRLWTQKPDS